MGSPRRAHPAGTIAHARRNAEILDEIFDQSPSFMTLTVGPEHVFERANKTFYEMLRLSPSIIGKGVREVFPELASQGLLGILDDTFRTGVAFQASEAEVRLAAPGGGSRTLYVDLVYQPIRDANGQVYGIVHQGADVTEKVLSRRAIENERENFRNLFRQTPEMVCILRGPEHVFEFVNEAHVRALGFDATGKSVREAQPESVEVHGILDEVYRTGITAELHEIMVTVTNRRRFFNLTYAARRNDFGAIDGIMILGIEVTDQVLARENLQRSEEKLKAAVQARDEFLSIASHELRTPLAALKLQHQSFARVSRTGGEGALGPARVERLVEQTGRQVTRLTRLVEDMLDVARIQSGNLAIARQPVELADIVREVVGRMEPVMKAEGTPLIVEGVDPSRGSLDAFRIEQVLTNLLTNAMRYGEQKPVHLKVTCTDGQALLSIRDQGRGIDKASLERIFNRFERFISANEVSGLGLGLFISRQIVQAHGGRIWVESPGLDQGSTFFVQLPLQAPSDSSSSESSR